VKYNLALVDTLENFHWTDESFYVLTKVTLVYVYLCTKRRSVLSKIITLNTIHIIKVVEQPFLSMYF